MIPPMTTGEILSLARRYSRLEIVIDRLYGDPARRALQGDRYTWPEANAMMLEGAYPPNASNLVWAPIESVDIAEDEEYVVTVRPGLIPVESEDEFIKAIELLGEAS